MQITRGKVKEPFKILLLARPGWGKTTFGASLPSPIFLAAENISEIDAPRFPVIKEFDEVFAQIKFLKENRGEYKTVILDTIDSLERLLHLKIINNDSKSKGSMAIAMGGYGRAYDAALSEMTKLRDELEDLRINHGFNICLLAHVKTKRTVDPVMAAEYDSVTTSLHDKTENLFIDWVSAVLFGTYSTHLKEDSSKTFALSDGERVIYTECRAGFVAKNRYELPYELEMPIENPSAPFIEGYEAFYQGNKRPEEQVKESIESLIAQVEDQNLKEKMLKAYAEAQGYERLVLIEKTIKERLGL